MSAADEDQKLLSGGDPMEDPQQQGTANKWNREVLITRIIYGVVGVIVLGVIAAVVVILITTFTNNSSDKLKYKFDTMFNGSLSARMPSVVWTLQSGQNEAYYATWSATNTSCALLLVAAKGQTPQTLVSNDDLNRFDIPCYSDFSTSFDNSFVSFKLNQTKVFRHSILGQYVLFNVKDKTATPVSDSTQQKTLVWCAAGNVLAYVENNNIFVKDLAKQSNPQVTTDGDAETIFYGSTDWLYEEEVFAAVNSLTFSPDCSKLAFLKLNDTNVPFYEWSDFEPGSSTPIKKKIRIPTSGQSNPVPTVLVYDFATAQTSTLDIGSNTDVYIYDLLWSNSTMLAAIRLNREQNQKVMLVGNVAALSAGVIPTVSYTVATSNTWIQFQRAAFFIPGTLQFVDVIENDDHYNIALFDLTNPGSIFVKFIAAGAWDVLDLFKVYNAATNEIYYTSTEQGTTDKHVYAVRLDGTGKRWLSGGADKGNGKQGNGYVDCSPSPSGLYMFMYYQGPSVPKTSLVDTATNTTIVVLEKNEALDEVRKDYNLPTAEIRTISNGKGDQLNALFNYPPGFSEGVQYPVLMNVYGGPGASLVFSSYASLYKTFNMYIASLGFIVVTVDGRGTGGKGVKFMTQTYKNLGTMESEDQITAAKYLKTLNYVNGNQIAIWGWSYGGYTTLMSITSALNQKVFSLGISVAPVTDWTYYDTAYTERYMLWPTINEEGYRNSSVLQRVADKQTQVCNKDLPIGQGKTNLLLVHGLSDENVRTLNSFNLMTMMQNCGVQFEFMTYPNKDHSIAGTATRKHLYRMLSNKLQTVTFGAVQDV